MQEYSPDNGLDLQHYLLLGRGPGACGGNKSWKLAGFMFRCARCGDCMPENNTDFFTCACRAMHLDRDYHRFGSSLGDSNILVYKRTD